MLAFSQVVCYLFLLGVLCDAEQPPNIIIFLADDLGWNDVSFHGSRQIPTPNIDALAYDGIIFDNYYVQPICSQSRAAILTARYPIHLGLQHGVINGCRRYGLGLNETLLPQYLKELGYATHGLGKWHLGFYTDQYVPSNRGFDTYFGMYAGTGDYWTHCYDVFGKGVGSKGYGLDLHLNNKLVKDKFGVYGTTMFSSAAEDIIESHNTSQPLFVYFAEQAVHAASVVPLEAPYEYVKQFGYIKDKKRRTFAGMVSALDDSVGNVTKALFKRGMLNNTIIVFTTDNGGPVAAESTNCANNWPLRGEKTTLWEGGVRGSSFVWSPLLKQTRRISHQLMHITDWLPTLLHAAGYDMSKLAKKPLDGTDQWDELSQDLPSKRNEILLNIDPAGNLASGVRVGDYKLLYHGSNRTAQWFNQPQYHDYEQQSSNALEHSNDTILYFSAKDSKPRMTNDEQPPEYLFHSDLNGILESIGRGRRVTPSKPLVVECGEKPSNASWNCNFNQKPCLYNIINDPCEYNNLAESRPDLVAQLMGRLNAFRESMVAMKNKPIDPAGLPGNNGWAFQPWVKPEEDKYHLYS